jgi:hypothetical protein
VLGLPRGAGTLLDLGCSSALQKRLSQEGIRCFDLKVFAEPLREAIGIMQPPVMA